MRYGIDEADFDWFVVDIGVKRADMQQRHRFVDTIRKLEAYLQTRKAEPDYDAHNPIFITVSEAANITGRNRKTIADWTTGVKQPTSIRYRNRHTRRKYRLQIWPNSHKRSGQAHRF